MLLYLKIRGREEGEDREEGEEEEEEEEGEREGVDRKIPVTVIEGPVNG